MWVNLWFSGTLKICYFTAPITYTYNSTFGLKYRIYFFSKIKSPEPPKYKPNSA
jgi:hypothetical protein